MQGSSCSIEEDENEIEECKVGVEEEEKGEPQSNCFIQRVDAMFE